MTSFFIFLKYQNSFEEQEALLHAVGALILSKNLGFNKKILISYFCGNPSVMQFFTWSYSLTAVRKRRRRTSSKQWIHFLRSLLWPPTSIFKTRGKGFCDIYDDCKKGFFWSIITSSKDMGDAEKSKNVTIVVKIFINSNTAAFFLKKIHLF